MEFKLALFILPLIYVLIPFILSGTFIILGGVTILALIIGMTIFIIITNLQLGGSAQALASGGSLQIGMSDSGGYSLFIIFFGGLFYLGATLAQFIAPILEVFASIINSIVGFMGWVTGIDVSSLQTSTIASLGGANAINLGAVYPLGLSIQGISIFGALSIIFASMFILSLYLMISQRG